MEKREMDKKEEIYEYQYSVDVERELSMIKEAAPSYGNWKKQGEYTIDDYYALPEDVRVELIDGVFYFTAAPSIVHQDIAFTVHTVLHNYIREKKKPCKVYEAALDVQISCDNRTMVQPDVLVVCDRDKLRKYGIYGAPDFVLEVLSKSTRKKDMTVKLNKYFEAGVKEYWIIDPDKELLITYHFEKEQKTPHVYPLEGGVPVAITGDELQIDLGMIAELIEEYRDL